MLFSPSRLRIVRDKKFRTSSSHKKPQVVALLSRVYLVPSGERGWELYIDRRPRVKENGNCPR